jgi:queuine tRNA-ribosyltransferase
MYADLRAESAAYLSERPFAGLAIGGLSVGEPKTEMYRVLSLTAPLLPQEKPRYLMGVGTPPDLVNAVSAGVDMFDCVLPTRNARNGQAFTASGVLNIKNAVHATDSSPLDPQCSCYTCAHFSRAYLHHLYKAKEILVSVLMTLHNLYYYQSLMAAIRAAIRSHTLTEFKQRLLVAYDALDIHQVPEAG